MASLILVAGESSIYLNFLVVVLNIDPMMDLAMATETSLNVVFGNLLAGTEPGSVPGVNSTSTGSSYLVITSGREYVPL